MWREFKPYVSVAQRRAKAARMTAALAKKGRVISPVKPAGRKITTTFWGNSWCGHLESYSDFSNRLGRGRTYIRNGSVIDLQIRPGSVTALVSGSEVYEIKIDLSPLPKSLWQTIKARCAGKIGSLVDLLQGKLTSDVMGMVTARDGGLFPQPKEIRMKCSCPDYARLCKHLAAVLYGIGTRFDERPELFFQLRNVDHLELIAAAGAGVTGIKGKAKHALAEDSLADIFGIELAGSSVEPIGPAESKRSKGPHRLKGSKGPAAAAESASEKTRLKKPIAKRPTRKAATRPTESMTDTRAGQLVETRAAATKPTTQGRTKSAKSVLAKKRSPAGAVPAGA